MTSRKTPIGGCTDDDANPVGIKESRSFFTGAGNSSIDDDWETPADLAELLSEAAGGFDLDPCAATHNPELARVKAKTLLTVEDDGLAGNWFGMVFCNPPYGRRVTEVWARKCATEAANGATVVALLPSRTCTKWWHDHVPYADIFMLKGRLKFGDGKGSAPFASAIVVWNGSPELIARLCAALPTGMYVQAFTPMSWAVTQPVPIRKGRPPQPWEPPLIR